MDRNEIRAYVKQVLREEVPKEVRRVLTEELPRKLEEFFGRSKEQLRKFMFDSIT